MSYRIRTLIPIKPIYGLVDGLTCVRTDWADTKELAKRLAALNPELVEARKDNLLVLEEQEIVNKFHSYQTGGPDILVNTILELEQFPGEWQLG